MTPKKMLTAGAIAGSLVLGAGTGALLFTPALSSAQDTTTTTTAESEKDLAPRRGHGVDLAAAAEAIGITTDQLRTELQDGKTMADVAKAHDVDPQKVIDALVAAGKERLEQAIEDLPDRMKEVVNSTAPLGRHGPGRGLLHAGLETVASTIGITEDELRAELRDGKTIAAVATAHDVDPQKVIDAVVAAATKRIDAAVASGDLTQARADELKADLEDHATRLVNETRPVGGPGRHQLRGNEDSSSTADGAAYALS
jgi:urease gamma subunit